jgi:hypothetical protein
MRQACVGEWVRGTFGDRVAASMPERGMRLLEEALETAQAAGVDRSTAIGLVARVYSRPVGDLHMEAGAVGVTLLALAAASGFSADGAEQAETARVIAIPKGEMRRRHAAKVAQGVAI